jgi:hypothetical protein
VDFAHYGLAVRYVTKVCIVSSNRTV